MVILGNMTDEQSKCLATNLHITEDEHFECITNSTSASGPCHNVEVTEINTVTDNIVNIEGIFLSVHEKANIQNSTLVPVKSTLNNLRSLALAVASGKALCLMGPVGSGKTSLVEHLAVITGRKGVAFKKVQLGDQTDSRTLLGTHQCTDVPGEFIWRPGVLTEAVQSGHWLLLEDIDCAALDVASTLSSLLERNALSVPGYRDFLPVTPGFQLFVTQRTVATNYGFQKKISNASTLLQRHLTQINVEPLSRLELSEIICKMYPSLKTVCPKMIEVFMMFSVGSHDSSLQTDCIEKDSPTVSLMRGSRLISTRDLMKWCSRAMVGYDVTSPEAALKILQDALDIFICSISSPEDRLHLAKKIACCLGVIETKAQFYSQQYKPNVALHASYLEVGRAKIVRKEKDLSSVDLDAKQVVFSFTRPSTCLLERIACCIMSNEPVLLVGETGTGKTSSIQYLAKQTGNKLVVINMNQQSDSADLLGGYKPVDFKYIRGSLVKAMQEGHWVLLDEINLASAEILECLAGLLEDKSESIDLLEKSDKTPIRRHQNFTLFACMNPATDVGKKDLPVGLRNRFTEFFIEELIDKNDLIMLIGDYLYHMNLNSTVLEAIYRFYTNIRKEAKLTLVDGAGNAPHYSLRTLCRALTAAAKAKCGTVARSLYEAFCLAFLTQLDSSSHPIVEKMIAKAVVGKKDLKLVLNQAIPEPKSKGESYLLFEGHWIPRGKLEISIPDDYILTLTVKKNLRDIARVISLGRLPVLLQGDTSVGKTSLITYIAKASGNYCVRINNHEHTDLQEYIGSYATDSSGKLIFKEGVLVEAMRKGYWIILDELNLAPSDVLEALNRVLDDNRELYILETQKVVKADPNFMLFATQNPPGLYGGRKMLSRAFRNRFVELHFDEIPRKELEVILHRRCHVPQKYAKNMIAVMGELQMRRRGSAAVQGKDGFITLRDLFRWGQRYKLACQQMLTSGKFYDWDQHIADEGYLILAGKVRHPEERDIIEQVIEKHIKRKVNPENLFSLHDKTSSVTKSILEELLNTKIEGFSHLVWTYNMRRLAVLIAKSFIFTEPVLLVGETGCGKTTVCQVLSVLKKTKLLTVNCHMHTESADFLGGLRPVRQYKNDGRLFEWIDGPLIKAMEQGYMFLADEISLADDSVLERLNSLLEPERQLVLSERGTEDGKDIVVVTANNNFYFIGTMNPGGDFGKKELSPALRNRFTEIWCDSVTSKDDLLQVLEKSVNRDISLANQQDGTSGLGKNILDFTDYLKNTEVASKFPFSIRDLLSWVNFINSTVSKGPKYNMKANENLTFTFSSPTTGANTLRLLRGLQLNKAILLEGNPGVGKTSLVTALAKASGHKVVRINLSDQTDVTDLFGTDLPTEDGSFTFKEGTFLKALQNGHWILLDELNLAPQPVLEGLNACLDHRGEVYIPELGETFKVAPQTRLFACQNPLKQGGARRGLPVSFLNRFTQVYIDKLTEDDLIFITESQYPTIPKDILCKIVKFNCRVSYEITVLQSWGHRGSPWEMNLRDVQRWCDAIVQDQRSGRKLKPGKYVDILYIHRMRTMEDKQKMITTYDEIFCPEYLRSDSIPQFLINDDCITFGDVQLNRNKDKKAKNRRSFESRMILMRHQQPVLRSVAQCIEMNWLSILVGSTSTGKSSIIQILADLTGNELHVVPVTSALDISDLLGGFEQVDYNRHLEILYEEIEAVSIQTIRDMWIAYKIKTSETNKILRDLHRYKTISNNNSNDNDSQISNFSMKLELLNVLCVRLLFWNKENVKIFDKVKKLASSLNELKQKVSAASTINAGGKFEWINSLLVKAMFEGSWVLLDNVNLTSAAVLDRLNGLLEPNGVLSMSETGESYEIEPHPNFRIFFTMDPKHGEISRAMRNRGVEIFVLRPDDRDLAINESIPNLDLVALLSSCGLPTQYHSMCIQAHKLMAAFIHVINRPQPALGQHGVLKVHTSQFETKRLWEGKLQQWGFDKPTISHLLQASHLAWQQIVRGISYEIAIINSFLDVYIKPRCGGDFATSINASLAEMKNAMLIELKKFINTHTLQHVSENKTHTLTVADSGELTYETVALNDSLAYCKELDELINLLWGNIVTLDTSSMLKHVTSSTDLLKELLMKIKKGPQLKKIIKDLLVFPNNIPHPEEKEEYLSRYLSQDFVCMLDNSLPSTDDDVYRKDIEHLKILKMNLKELNTYCTTMEEIDYTTFSFVITVLNAISNAWDKQEKDIQKQKEADEALYVTKSKCEDMDEEEQFELEVSEMFPSFSETDFDQFKPPTLDKKNTRKSPSNQMKLIMPPEDISLVYKWHSKFMKQMTTAEWLKNSEKLSVQNYAESFLAKFEIFTKIMHNSWDALDVEMEGLMSPSLMVILSKIENKLSCSSADSRQDFYRSSWVSEAKKCLPLLRKVKESTNKLLDEWPDFPSLKDIMVIVRRILSFPITSPVARFLTGLELLRDKIEEWNKNAHKGNNMIDISLEVGQQIIDWRKLELADWKECLKNVQLKKEAEAHKYWFYLYNIVLQYLETTSEDNEKGKDVKPPAKEEIIVVLKNFVEKSNLVEFSVKLDLLYIYHCHLVHLKQSSRRDELLAIFWNIYKYYAQFSNQVLSHIKEKRAPIEKKLQAFVKICSWDRDLSYWSVKDTVEKAQKKVLEENVVHCLLIDQKIESVKIHASGLDRPKRMPAPPLFGSIGSYYIDPQIYLIQPHQLKKYLESPENLSNVIHKGSILLKVPFYLNKAKTLCKAAMCNTTYSASVQALDDFVTQVIASSERLRDMQVDCGLPKEKQVSQAKNILQQKRKALADLFRYLSKMGLNYRKGLVMLSTNEELHDFTLMPVDLEAAMAYLKPRREDKQLSMFWNGCEDYYQKNIAMHKYLTAILLNPHKDLGISNLERCKGFAAQLMSITISQKKNISKYSRYVFTLRTLVARIHELQNVKCGDASIHAIDEKLELLSECYGNIDITLEQFMILVNSCPEKQIVTEYGLHFDASLSESRVVNCYRGSEEWQKLFEKISSLLTIVKKHKSAVHRAKKHPPMVVGDIKQTTPVCTKHAVIVEEAIDILKVLYTEIGAILQEYQYKFKSSMIDGFTVQHPMFKSLSNLTIYIDTMYCKTKDIDLLSHAATKPDKQMIEQEIGKIVEQLEDVVTTSLLTIEKLYKKHQPSNNATSEEEILKAIDECIKEEVENQNDIFKENCLRDDLHEKLSEDLKLLNTDTVIKKIYPFLNQYLDILKNDAKEVQDIKDEIMKCYPILGQTVLFVQYFLTTQVAAHRVSCKMLYILLSIFSDLAVKGFCTPTDLDVEAGEGEGTSSDLAGGMGLGEGEGKKDVSDRIENQDQLDDARRPGEEKDQDDKDCKEEEKGVNMTDDFDSHLQDVEKKDGEDSDEGDNEDDVDKQMGETDNTAEKLDQQIWGSEEDENEELDQKDKEEKGTGESTGEKEMAAKEQEEGLDDTSKGKDKKQKNDINEMRDQEIDDDHIDPHHGKENQIPEPQDLPDNIMDMDTDDRLDEKDGETETENPFELNVPDDKIPEIDEPKEEQNEEGDKNKHEHGMEVSSDEEGQGEEFDQEKNDEDDQNEKEKDKQKEVENQDEQTDENDVDVEQDKMDTDQVSDEDEKEEDDAQDLPRNPDQVDEEDSVEQKKRDSNPNANPSNDDASKEEKAENAETEKGTHDNVQTNPDQEKDEDAAPFEQAQEQVGQEKRGTGRAELDQSEKGHQGEKQTAKKAHNVPNERRNTKSQNKPGQTEEERTLEKEEDATEDGGEEETKDAEADAYQHVKQARRDDQQVVDAATKEQAEKQPILKEDEENIEEMKSDEEIPMDVNDDLQVNKAENELLPERPDEGTKEDKDKKSDVNKETGEEPTGESMLVEGELVATATAPRGNETTYHTRADSLAIATIGEELSAQQYMNIREWLSEDVRSASGANEAWRTLWHRTGAQARTLTERLRLILEPTGRSRLTVTPVTLKSVCQSPIVYCITIWGGGPKINLSQLEYAQRAILKINNSLIGDYRTGRRINMRRVIPYVASQFRRDRIWLRRTKPAKREYKIALAIDDSSSMNDTKSMELAFESLALVTQARDIAVLSFGIKPKVLHPFSEQFSEHSGAKILDNLRFEQGKTNIAQLLDFVTVMFEEQTIRSDALNAKLLVIVGDGQGIYAEGVTVVEQAVRRARQSGIFIVYVIADDLNRKYSIMDIQTPITIPSSGDTTGCAERSMIGFTSYLDNFPIPFYLILRDLSALPMVLGDALRQWFELAANTT
ncbi:Midasin [Eumeta japonica]|uniref:Midasin n=1 Tax=Eumeta variegata TaxID=151549 RepID=A0A4C1UBH1_EUMVA|nr:Midasin [Eumeta japonica]